MVRPTKTTNRIHLTDLDHRRFEDLCLAMIYNFGSWSEIRHYGRSGGDQGVDIWCKQHSRDGSASTWFVQCRRYDKAGAATLKAAVDDSLSHADELPEVLLVVVACDVSRAAHESFMDYAKKRGVKTPKLWTQSVIEAHLYNERKDLLFSYFGISEPSRIRSAEASIKRNLAMKKRVGRELVRPLKAGPNSWSNPENPGPWDQFICGEAIVRSIEDKSYPGIDDVEVGPSSWFKTEFFDLYHDGIEFVLQVESIVVADDGRWAIVPFQAETGQLSVIKAFRLGRMPYREIVEIDPSGDLHYSQPHIYCRFAEKVGPWEAFVFRPADEDEIPWTYEEDAQVEFEVIFNEEGSAQPNSSSKLPPALRAFRSR